MCVRIYIYVCMHIFIYLLVCVWFYDAVRIPSIPSVAPNGRMTGKRNEKDLEGSAHGLLAVVSRTWLEGSLRKTRKKYSSQESRFFGRNLNGLLVLDQLTLCSVVGGN